MKRVHLSEGWGTAVIILAVMAILAITVLPSLAHEGMKKADAESNLGPSMTQEGLRDAMRNLWDEHVVYTRNFIVSDIGGLEDLSAVTERLLRNQDDIGNAIKPFYGDEAGNKLAKLLREHILIAADIVNAAKAGDNSTVNASQKKWRQNADEIAAFLSGANPAWPKTTLTNMLYKHLDMTTTEVVSRLTKDWKGEITAYDQGHEHMMMLADALTDGIVKQFPGKFQSAVGYGAATYGK